MFAISYLAVGDSAECKNLLNSLYIVGRQCVCMAVALKIINYLSRRNPSKKLLSFETIFAESS
jgi:hypothetical protein